MKGSASNIGDIADNDQVGIVPCWMEYSKDALSGLVRCSGKANG